VAKPEQGFFPESVQGTLELHGMPEGSIFEVWINRRVTKRKTRSFLERVAVVDASGVLVLGTHPAPQESYELGHLVP
jgi:hypothetical protein